MAKIENIIKEKGISLLIPNTDSSDEHFDIKIYTKCLSKEEKEMLKDFLGL